MARDHLSRAHSVVVAAIEARIPSLVVSFVRAIVKDAEALRAAIASRSSNGQTDGQITKLKLVKRQMYVNGGLIMND